MPTTLPPGRQPYDPLNALRIGSLAGGVIGIVLGALTGAWWLLLVGVVGGGAAGFGFERRERRRRT